MEKEEQVNVSDEGRNSAFHFFLYLVHFFTMGFSVFGCGAILFQIVNKYVPDPYEGILGFVFYQSSVKFGIASILVAGPIFFFTRGKIVSYMRDKKISSGSLVRKWLTYIVLFFAAATGVGDLIAVIFAFLEGDIVMRFFIKAIIVLIFSGVVFGFYFWDIRKKDMQDEIVLLNRKITLGAMIIFCVVFVSGFFIIDSPKIARLKKIDLQKTSDLSSVDQAIRSYFSQAGKLPADVASLENSGLKPFLQGNIEDISYEIKGEKEFSLCAVFQRSDLEDKDAVLGEVPDQWRHAAGKYCFDRIALESPDKK